MLIKYDLKNGLIYNKDKEKKLFNNIDEYKNLRYKILPDFIHNIEKHKQIIDIIQICPSGSLCEGNCLYCYNNYFAPMNKNFISADKISADIVYLKNNIGTPEYLEIDFTGGEFLLNNNIIDIIDVINKNYPNTVFNFVFMVSCFYNKEQLDYLYKIIYYAVKIPRVKRICLNITMDIDGSNYRSSIIKHMNNDDALNVAYKVIKEFKNNKKIIYNICTKISKCSNSETYINNIHKLENTKANNLIVSVSLVEGEYSPSIQTIDNIIDTIKKEYELYFPYSMKMLCININTKLSHYMSKVRSLLLMQIEDGIYCAHPFNSRCWAGIRTLNITPDKYSICKYTPITTESITEALTYDFRCKCGVYNDWCSNCELQGFCELCSYFDCRKNNSRKHFSKLIIDTLLNRPKTWFITSNILKKS